MPPKNAMCSSCVCTVGRNVSVPNERSKSPATAGMSFCVARRITRVLYECAEREKRARPPDEDLHPRRRPGRDEPRRRVARAEARSPDRRLRMTDELNSLIGVVPRLGRSARGAPARARARPERAVRRRRRSVRSLRRARRASPRHAADDRRPRAPCATSTTRCLPELKSFVLPGGTDAAARLNVCARRGPAVPSSPRWPPPRSTT